MPKSYDSQISVIQKYYVNVDVKHSVGNLNLFWKSTGLCPPDPHQEASKFFSTDDFNLNVALIGSLPSSGITNMRIHWLLDLVDIVMNPNGTVLYNYMHLDELIAKLWQYRICVGFELMGNPSGIFSDFENSTQIYWWKDLVEHLAKHYVDLYGENYVSCWKFETWNEPDHHDFDGLNITVQGFLNYYDACSEGLLAASKLLKIGGPGGSCHPTYPERSCMCWALLKHCMSGTNYFTGSTGIRLDFISFHKKGNGTSEEILEDTVQTMEFIHQNFPKLASIPFYNDEADPLKNWALPKWWRTDATYAALVAKVISQHIQLYFQQDATTNSSIFKLGLLSNDNAFLSYYPYQFSQRTLLARFQINNTFPKHVQYVRKPVYSVMGLMSQLCNELVQVKIALKDGFQRYSDQNLGGVATVCKDNKFLKVSILLYNSADTNDSTGIAYVDLNLHNMFKQSDIRWVHYQIDNVKTNPYASWKAMGYPAFPTIAQLSIIKSYEEPYLEEIGILQNVTVNQFKIKLRKPGISFLNICVKRSSLVVVKNVKIFKISRNSIQITWKDSGNRCVLCYNIEHSLYIHGPYKRINQKNVYFPSFWYSCSEDEFGCKIEGFYRIQVVDYWKIAGPFSRPVEA